MAGREEHKSHVWINESRTSEHVGRIVLEIILYFISLTVDPEDYIAFPPLEQLPDSFTPARSRQCFNVVIINDTIPEIVEQFTVTLTDLVDQTNFPRISVNPDLATITIEDDDSKCSWLLVFVMYTHPILTTPYLQASQSQ